MITLLVGNIASGKSTYAKEEANSGAVVINDDAIVSAVHGSPYHLYDEDMKPLYKAVETHLAMTALAMRKDVVIDQPNHSLKQRARWLALADTFDVAIGVVIFPRDHPVVHADRRTKSDGRGHPFLYWLDVAKRIDAEYEEATEDEGYRFIHRQ